MVMMNVWGVDIILYLLKINVKIKSDVDRIWKEQYRNNVWWNREESGAEIVPCVACHTRHDFSTRLATNPPDCRRLVSYGTIEIASDRIGSNREQKSCRLRGRNATINTNPAHTFYQGFVVWTSETIEPRRDAFAECDWLLLW